MVVIQDGIILEVDNYKNIYKKYHDIDLENYNDSVILPGFIDCHVHYVQSPMIGSYGGTLLEWLNNCTFPTEAKFKDKNLPMKLPLSFLNKYCSKEPQLQMCSAQHLQHLLMHFLKSQNVIILE